jgi:hypothetical protein
LGRRGRGTADHEGSRGIAALLLLAGLFALAPAPSRCVECHRGLAQRLARPVARFERSVHALAQAGCHDCHGGDPAARRGGPAHAAFPGHPAASEIAALCGRCHAAAEKLYAASGHARLRADKPAVGCVDCHGSHDVGNPPALFRLAEYCGSCHGVEYLPALPRVLGAALEADDRLTEVLRGRFSRKLAADGGAERVELRRKLGDLVHRGSLDLPSREVEEWTVRIEALRARLEKAQGRE